MAGNNIFFFILLAIIGLACFGLQRLHRALKKNAGRFPLLLAANLLVLILLLAVVTLAGETWCRFFLDSSDAFGLSLVSQRWHQRHYRLNQAGARDSIEYEARKRPNARRLTILGDSFAAGYGLADVEQRFANRLRQTLGSAWEVHVIAADGMDTGEELLQLREAVEQGYELDVLLLAYCLNDISDIVPDWQKRLERIYAGRERPNLLLRNSFFIDLLACRLLAATNPDVQNYYGFVKEAYHGDIWNSQQTRLRLLADFCRGHRAKLLAATFPFFHKLGPDYEYAKVHRRLDEFWQTLETPHLDMLSIFSNMPSATLVANPHDPHPNAKAHAIAAEAIKDFILNLQP